MVERLYCYVGAVGSHVAGAVVEGAVVVFGGEEGADVGL
jgi:hypothetical protein